MKIHKQTSERLHVPCAVVHIQHYVTCSCTQKTHGNACAILHKRIKNLNAAFIIDKAVSVLFFFGVCLCSCLMRLSVCRMIDSFWPA